MVQAFHFYSPNPGGFFGSRFLSWIYLPALSPVGSSLCSVEATLSQTCFLLWVCP